MEIDHHNSQQLIYTCSARDNNNNDNDKRLGVTAKADQPNHKKYSTQKININNEAVQSYTRAK